MIVLWIFGGIIAFLLLVGGIIFWTGFVWACFHKQELKSTKENYHLGLKD